MRRLSVQVDHSRRHERMQEMLLKYQSGVNVEEIAAQYDMSRGTVMRHARNAGLPKRSKQLISDEIRQHILQKLKENVDYKEIQELFNVSAGFISQFAKENGLSRYENNMSGLFRTLGVVKE